jgi:hypothetical protein
MAFDDQTLTVSQPRNGDRISEFAITTTRAPLGGHKSTSYRNPAYLSALVADGMLPLLSQKLGIVHLIISGITTSGPVLGTTMHATDLDSVVTVVEDASWDTSAQVHQILIDSVIPTLAWVSTVEEAVGSMTV